MRRQKSPVITPDVLNRTFHLRCGPRKGTCFSLDVDGRQYVVTASHLLRAHGSGAVVEIVHGGKWKPLDTAIVGFGPPQVDVAVLALKFRIALPEFSLPAAMAGLTRGQDAFCLGFPYGEWRSSGTGGTFPVPFVKKAVVSHVPEDSSVVRCFYLDGMSNAGFSGGPVVYRADSGSALKVAAVVSAFQYENEPVYLGSDQIHLSAGQNPDLILAYDINHALDLINLNPIGCPLKE